ncbi:STAS domain-containing protein [Actinophytocola algeriensis]|jgi:anti-anti-sigma factor|uniref:Anti-sigma factor antagonist n=1 Tax=Actinophytocola algeriensis TaxID=1768010 RepID=A0A7W7QF71_9PSEU|nr:STAS domain-containing protein [Actinophytocola algeriensis]MBB4912516.1 anti-anti-sigma factor [Actinophytocola algeriensis]MBE1478890.1 anti-anti-sigma factor [Actinophytocola algeriensis]
MSLAITVHGSNVRLAGAVDLQTAPALRAELTELINAAGQGAELRVDLGDVSIVDSSGLSALVGAHRLAAAKNSRLMLTGLPDHLTRMLTITGLDELLDLA